MEEQPRGFANEYTIYVGNETTIRQLLRYLERQNGDTSKYQWLNKRQAIYYGNTLPRRDRNYSISCWNGGRGYDTDDSIEIATRETLSDLFQFERCEQELADANQLFGYGG
jgi:hypothetical protein